VERARRWRGKWREKRGAHPRKTRECKRTSQADGRTRETKQLDASLGAALATEWPSFRLVELS